jgi:hypothetical protein
MQRRRIMPFPNLFRQAMQRFRQALGRRARRQQTPRKRRPLVIDPLEDRVLMSSSPLNMHVVTDHHNSAMHCMNQDRYLCDKPEHMKEFALGDRPNMVGHDDAGLLRGDQGLVPDYRMYSDAGAQGSANPTGLTPAQIRHAYGFDQILFWQRTNSPWGPTFSLIPGDGRGQTIAIIVSGDNPKFLNSTDPNFNNSDLHQFDLAFNLPDPPSFMKVAQDGSNNLPGAIPNSNWPLEIAFDVEWAHAIAPQANILLVEATTSLQAAIAFAAQQPGVSVVSMSFEVGEWSNNTLLTPPGHAGVTFVAASGDHGVPVWPGRSPYVLDVGGTTLTLDANNNYLSETAWNSGNGLSGGGGFSDWEQPAYQAGVIPVPSSYRGAPDVAYAATGFAIYDSLDNGTATPWGGFMGTSAGAPQWAALIAIADQGRALHGLGSLDGDSQTLPLLYSLPASDFHDITTGGNGQFMAGPGYDLVTGRGSPIANRVVADLSTRGTPVLGGVVTAFGSGAITFSPDGQNLGGGGSTSRLYSGTQTVVAMIPYKGGIITAFSGGGIYFSPDGTNPGGGGNTKLVYAAPQFSTNRLVSMIPYGTGVLTTFSSFQYERVYYSPDGLNLGGGGNTSQVYSGSARVVSMLPYQGGVLTAFAGSSLLLSQANWITYSPDGRNLGGGGNTVLVYYGSQQVVSMIRAPAGGVYTAFANGGIWFSHDDPAMWNLSTGSNNSFQIYSGTAQVVTMIPYQGGVITEFANGNVYYSPDGFHLAGGGNTILAYASPRFSTRQLVKMMPYRGGVLSVFADPGLVPHYSIYFSPDGSNLGGGGNTALVYYGTDQVLGLFP